MYDFSLQLPLSENNFPPTSIVWDVNININSFTSFYSKLLLFIIYYMKMTFENKFQRMNLILGMKANDAL
jgi:hypothetical protein